MTPDSQNVAVSFSELPDISHEPRFDTRVISRTEIGKERIVIRLERPKDFSFSAGQYLWLVLPAISPEAGKVDRRAYSIASAPDDDFIELFIRLNLSDYLAAVSRLSPGDEVQIIGPYGSTFVSSEKGAVCIAGGTGIAPFLSIVRSRKSPNYTLVSYTGESQPQYLEAELRDQAQRDGLQVFFRHGQPQTDDFREVVNSAGDRPFNVSGPQGFVDAVTSILTELGVDKARLRYEALYPSINDTVNLEAILGPIISADMKSSVSNSSPPTGTPDLQDMMVRIIRQASNHIIVTDKNGYILFANPAAQELTGYTYREMYRQTPRLWGANMSPAYYANLWKRENSGQIITHQIINRRKNGQIYIALGRITPIVVDDHVIAYVATEEDVTSLKQIDRAKTEFVSLASHQLRTPLSAIGWYVEMLLNGDAGAISETQQTYLQEVYHANQRMVGLINALLNVSRLELGTFSFDSEELVPEAVAQPILTEIQTLVQTRNQTFTHTFSPQTPNILFDKKYLEMIYQNLLSNATKYTPTDGTISLSVEPVQAGDQRGNQTMPADGILINVTDTGYGIPVNAQSKIFTKMYRADNIREIDTDGTGLGLYIIKSIVVQSKGLLWFETVENKGTTFYVFLPLQTAEKPGTKKLA